MFFSGGVYSSLGAGRLLVKESIWLDSLTNCIKRQSCPWSAPQLIDGSTLLHRKSSRQNGGKSVACFGSPPSRAIYLPSPSSLALPLFTQNAIRFKFYPTFMCCQKLHKRASVTEKCAYHTLNMEICSENGMTGSLCCEAVAKFKKTNPV